MTRKPGAMRRALALIVFLLGLVALPAFAAAPRIGVATMDVKRASLLVQIIARQNSNIEMEERS